MNLLDLVSVECIRAPLKATEKRGVIDELVDVLAEAGRAGDAGALKQAVWAREQTRTTGIGHGLAIPHGKSESLAEPAIAIGKPEEPLEFEAIDGKPVRLVVLLASPVDRTSDHIQALAQVSRLMTGEAFRDQIYAASDSEAIMDLVKEGVSPS